MFKRSGMPVGVCRVCHGSSFDSSDITHHLCRHQLWSQREACNDGSTTIFVDPAFDREHSPQDVDLDTQIVLSESFKKRNLPILEQSCLFWQKRSTILKRPPQRVKLETRHLYLTLG